MMGFRRLRNALTFALLLAAGHADAQQLTHQQLIHSLGQAAQAAPVVDLEVLAQDVNANVGKGVAMLPSWSLLATLPQFAVEIDFENNSVAIMPESYRTIGLIADALHYPRLLHYKFLVVGHTSSTGDAKHNLDLSLRRAEAIRSALTTTFSISPSHLVSIGVGEEWPIDVAKPEAASNRRVQLINLGLMR